LKGKQPSLKLSCSKKAITVIENSWAKFCLYEMFYFVLFHFGFVLSNYFIFRWLQGTWAINFFLCSTLIFPGLAIIFISHFLQHHWEESQYSSLSCPPGNPRPGEEK